MKCLACPAEIDELRQFASAVDARGQVVEDALGKLQHRQALAGWTHVFITAQTGAGARTLVAGHVCPAHDLADLVVSDGASRSEPAGSSSKKE